VLPHPHTGSEEETEVVRSALASHHGSGMLKFFSGVALGRVITIRLAHARTTADWEAYKQWLIDRGISTPLANDSIRQSALFSAMPNIAFHKRMSRILHCFKSFIALIAKNPRDWETLGSDFNGVAFSLGKGSHSKTLSRVKAAPMTVLLGGHHSVRDAALFGLKANPKPNLVGFHEGVEVTLPSDEDMLTNMRPWTDEQQVRSLTFILLFDLWLSFHMLKLSFSIPPPTTHSSQTSFRKRKQGDLQWVEYDGRQITKGQRMALQHMTTMQTESLDPDEDTFITGSRAGCVPVVLEIVYVNPPTPQTLISLMFAPT
jgi:hypothetical protein